MSSLRGLPFSGLKRVYPLEISFLRAVYFCGPIMLTLRLCQRAVPICVLRRVCPLRLSKRGVPAAFISEGCARCIYLRGCARYRYVRGVCSLPLCQRGVPATVMSEGYARCRYLRGVCPLPLSQRGVRARAAVISKGCTCARCRYLRGMCPLLLLLWSDRGAPADVISERGGLTFQTLVHPICRDPKELHPTRGATPATPPPPPHRSPPPTHPPIPNTLSCSGCLTGVPHCVGLGDGGREGWWGVYEQCVFPNLQRFPRDATGGRT